MSDTIIVWELCRHKEAHPHDWDYMTVSYRCPGGREIMLQPIINTRHVTIEDLELGVYRVVEAGNDN